MLVAGLCRSGMTVVGFHQCSAEQPERRLVGRDGAEPTTYRDRDPSCHRALPATVQGAAVHEQQDQDRRVQDIAPDRARAELKYPKRSSVAIMSTRWQEECDS